MDAKEIKLYTIKDNGAGIGNAEYNPYTKAVIKTENLQLQQTGLGLTIDVPFSALCKIETIEINGIKFKKENDNEIN